MTRKQKLYEAIAISKQAIRALESIPKLKFGKDLADEVKDSHKRALEWAGRLQLRLLLTLERENKRGEK